VPEFYQGHNIADYIDPDIFEKLEQLEKEEELREKAGQDSFYCFRKYSLYYK
jgi:nucleolar GTP-binding protein